MHRLIALLSLLILAVAVTACQRTEVDGITSRTGDEEFPPQADLESFAGCSVGDFGWVRGTGVILNGTPETASYEVVVSFEADGVRLDQGSRWIRDLSSGGRAEFEAVAYLGDRAEEMTDCRVITINRF